MGGFGSFYLCARRPKDFAAAMPICGGGDLAKAKDMAQIAFWVFHGDADNVVQPDSSRKMVAALKEAGAKVKYTEYPGVGHDSWTRAYKEPGLVDWLFSQCREPAK
jgi:predicted peptidase